MHLSKLLFPLYGLNADTTACTSSYWHVWQHVQVPIYMSDSMYKFLLTCLTACTSSYWHVWLHVQVPIDISDSMYKFLLTCLTACTSSYWHVWQHVQVPIDMSDSMYKFPLTCLIPCTSFYWHVWQHVQVPIDMTDCIHQRGITRFQLRIIFLQWLSAATCLRSKQRIILNKASVVLEPVRQILMLVFVLRHLQWKWLRQKHEPFDD